MVAIDTSTELGARVAQRLATEQVLWLTTTGANDQPQPRLVWYLWEGESFLIYSQPNQPKLRHIAARPQVALNLNSNQSGGDEVVFLGTAEILDGFPLATDVPAYVEKYAGPIKEIGMEPAGFAAAYSVAIRVTPTKMRGH